MKKYLSMLLMAVMFAFTACNDGDDGPNGDFGAIQAPTPTQLNQTVYADQTQGKSGVNFTTEAAWTSSITDGTASPSGIAQSSAPEWVSITPDYGDAAGSYNISINLEPNTTGKSRKATITIICGTSKMEIKITQDSKNEDGSQEPAESTGLVKKVVSKDGLTEMNFTYDSQKRLIGVRATDNEEYNDGFAEMDIQYLNATTVKLRLLSNWVGDSDTSNPVGSIQRKSLRIGMKESESGIFEANVTVQLNSDGYITSGVEYTEDRTDKGVVLDRDTTSWTATYNNGYLNKITRTDAYGVDSDVCTWTNGNLTGIAYSESYITASATYHSTYQNKGHFDMNWLVYEDEWFSLLDEYVFDMMGMYGKRSKNLVTSSKTTISGSNYGSQYSYVLDKNGYISEFTIDSREYVIQYY